ncbi:LuxR C-terminal-related transcriptional regulator [Egicoccus sp. AB-alg6-2]|uniref:LuxR C-terminal-related transcriptional regulator n=1 Tax=Egicoccus sp. AB-alg6-2 TaxID=3242692 RepID=UPI00359E64DF
MTDAEVAGSARGDGDVLDRAREAYVRRDWVTARGDFTEVRRTRDLHPDDLYALANCSWWLGDLDACLALQRQVHQRYLDLDDPVRAALVAIDVGYTHLIRGEEAQGSGWIGRAVRLLEDRTDTIEYGFLEYLDFESAFRASDPDGAMEAARRVQARGRRFADPTLTALGVLGEGRVLVRRGEVAAGMALLDEAMVAAMSEELDPGWAGNVYCHLMVACHEIADLRRAGEWTQVTADWCRSMPGAGPFMGICRVHRAQILQVRGDWDAAEGEAVHVCGELAHFDVEIVAEARYLLGELKRLRGDLAGAEASYREGHRLGRDPQPGLALLRVARGEADTAYASLHAVLAATEGDLCGRGRLLPAAVEVALAVGESDQARRWSGELRDIARRYGTTGFTAAALQAEGAVLLAGGEVEEARRVLRDALHAAREHEAPYDVARIRLLLATACEQLGDRESALLERDAAAEVFARLDIADPRSRLGRRSSPAGLTPRETEVLALVAEGRSNQDIAAELVLSIRTVERHLATVYQKLGLQGRSARAAAVSFALREGILTRR